MNAFASLKRSAFWPLGALLLGLIVLYAVTVLGLFCTCLLGMMMGGGLLAQALMLQDTTWQLLSLVGAFASLLCAILSFKALDWMQDLKRPFWWPF